MAESSAKRLKKAVKDGDENLIYSILDGIPVDVMSMILSLLPAETLFVAFNTSPVFAKLSLNPQLWKRLIQRFYPRLDLLSLDEFMMTHPDVSYRNVFFAYGTTSQVLAPSFNLNYYRLQNEYGDQIEFRFDTETGLDIFDIRILPSRDNLDERSIFYVINLVTTRIFDSFGLYMRMTPEFHGVSYDLIYPGRESKEEVKFKLLKFIALLMSIGYKTDVNPDSGKKTGSFTLRCNICGASPKVKCCKTGLYCNRKCQIKDWTIHKNTHF